MPGKIVYLVQRYKPHIEATSKEVKVLFDHHLASSLHDLHLDSYFSGILRQRRCSYHFLWYPLLFPFLYFYTFNKIKHIYTNLADFPYLPFLSKRKMIITSTNYFSREQLQKRLAHLQRVEKIIVESELQQQELLAGGIHQQKIEIIYPPVDLAAFQYRPLPLPGPLKILNASCPAKSRDLEKRGIFLLLDSFAHLQNTELTLLWREPEGEMHQFINSIKKNHPPGLSLRKEVLSDMNVEYGKYHGTVISYTRLSSRLKLIPNSAAESLAAGKPLLVSSHTGIAPIVQREKCGVVFEPNPESLLKAIEILRKKYALYQRNCRKTAEKYFSQELFIGKYGQIYRKIEGQEK